MEVACFKKGLCISLRKYIIDLLKETGMLGCKPSNTPIDPDYFLGKQNTLVNKEQY